ncbi:MAG: hypothetical protein K1V84_01085 [Muribaculaceae bacterium]
MKLPLNLRLSLLGLVAATAWGTAHVIRGHVATFADAIVLLAILGAAVMMARLSLTRNTARRHYNSSHKIPKA